MKVLHVITGLQKAAGTTTFVENAVRELRALGNEVDICTCADSSALARTDFDYDIVHIHGLWSSLLHRASRVAKRRGVPVVWSTHGMTAPWAMRHKRWKKFVPWLVYQRRDLSLARVVHCTVEQEAKWNRALGFARTFVAPLGTDLARVANEESVSTAGPRTLLYVGRIYPVKALDRLIRAYALTDREWNLRIVGPDQAGHRAELEALCRELDLSNVEFVGPKYGDDLVREYETCSALALVSHTENFGATVIDALACGKPVVTSTKTPWREVADAGCGWWVDNDPETLACSLRKLFALSDEDRVAMGLKGRALVESRYTWRSVARRIEEAYRAARTG